jgi:hypothetical protein
LLGRHDGGAAHSRYRQVGNAFPPLVAKAIGQSIRSALRMQRPPSRNGLEQLRLLEEPAVYYASGQPPKAHPFM